MMTTCNNVSVAQLLTGMNRKTVLVLTGSEVASPDWTDAERGAFAGAVLRDLPTPEIYLSTFTVDTDSGAGYDLVVDGRQRLLALLDYQKGRLSVPGQPTFAALDDKARTAFWRYQFCARTLDNLPAATVNEIVSHIPRWVR
jgi:hypothetical protein